MSISTFQGLPFRFVNSWISALVVFSNSSRPDFVIALSHLQQKSSCWTRQIIWAGYFSISEVPLIWPDIERRSFFKASDNSPSHISGAFWISTGSLSLISSFSMDWTAVTWPSVIVSDATPAKSLRRWVWTESGRPRISRRSSSPKKKNRLKVFSSRKVDNAFCEAWSFCWSISSLLSSPVRVANVTKSFTLLASLSIPLISKKRFQNNVDSFFPN